MSIDSIIQATMRSAVNLIASTGLSYRTGPTGTWLPFVGKFHAGATSIVGFDENHNAIMQSLTAHVKVPDNGVVFLIGAAGLEWQVKENDGTEWAVVGQSRHLGQTFYSLVRVVPVSLGMARGDVAT